MIKLLVVEDSPVVREFLVYILKSDPEIDVIGVARNGEEALEFVNARRPDVITMDINMPRMNGFDTTRRIMETSPVPIVIVSGSWNTAEMATTFRALEAGAVAVLARPTGLGHPDHEANAKELIQTVKLMSEVKVIRRWPRRRTAAWESLSRPIFSSLREREALSPPRDIRAAAIGASTGGPIVLQTILSRLPKDLPFPILIVQHIAPGFLTGFAEWLSSTTGFPAQIAAQDEPMAPGRAYLAPDGWQMGVKSRGRIHLSPGDAEYGVCPSVSFLFRSMANVFGANAAGILLTGMGKDGAEELRIMKEQGALTIVQDEESSVVYGMPGEAIRLHAAHSVLSPEEIASALEQLSREVRIKS
ncbi:MAG: chemotaxis-specific protein-glutamate methyltransferase CheB [Candidatus Omnitrophota bacterium]